MTSLVPGVWGPLKMEIHSASLAHRKRLTLGILAGYGALGNGQQPRDGDPVDVMCLQEVSDALVHDQQGGSASPQGRGRRPGGGAGTRGNPTASNTSDTGQAGIQSSLGGSYHVLLPQEFDSQRNQNSAILLSRDRFPSAASVTPPIRISPGPTRAPPPAHAFSCPCVALLKSSLHRSLPPSFPLSLLASRDCRPASQRSHPRCSR